MKFFFGRLLLVLSSIGCAVGPLVTHETARTVGKGRHELAAGYARSSFVGKWNYGISTNFDVGTQIERESWGYRLKYAVLNSSEGGISLAGVFGGGISLTGKHYYLDIMGSFLRRPWEPYANLRLVRVHTNRYEFKSDNQYLEDFDIPSLTYSYGQGMIGTRYWMGQRWFFSVEASTLLFVLAQEKISSNGQLFNFGIVIGGNF